jgi:hypothetical protein
MLVLLDSTCNYIEYLAKSCYNGSISLNKETTMKGKSPKKEQKKPKKEVMTKAAKLAIYRGKL